MDSNILVVCYLAFKNEVIMKKKGQATHERTLISKNCEPPFGKKFLIWLCKPSHSPSTLFIYYIGVCLRFESFLEVRLAHLV